MYAEALKNIKHKTKKRKNETQTKVRNITVSGVKYV